MDNAKREHKENVKKVQDLVETDGSQYAPIDINLDVTSSIRLPPIEWFNYNVAPKKMKITNTSFTVILSAKWMKERPFISSGPLNGNHVFSQLHFHWAGSNDEGSEHTADGEKFPLEMHIVHFNSVYGTQEMALTKKDGLSVLVYFYKIQQDDNPQIQDIIGSLPYVEMPHTSVHLELKPISELIRPFSSDYFLYWGSVMTSSCSHCILWFISREPIGISARQIERFRQIRGADNKPLRNNFRQVQPVFNRSIFHVSPSEYKKSAILPLRTAPSPNIIKTGNGYSVLSKRHTQKEVVKLKPNHMDELKLNYIDELKPNHIELKPNHIELQEKTLTKVTVSFSDIVNVLTTENPCSAALEISDDDDVDVNIKTKGKDRTEIIIPDTYKRLVAAYAETYNFDKMNMILGQKQMNLAVLSKAAQKSQENSKEMDIYSIVYPRGSFHVGTQTPSMEAVNRSFSSSQKDATAEEDHANVLLKTPINKMKTVMLTHVDNIWKEKTDITHYRSNNIQGGMIHDGWPYKHGVSEKHYKTPVNINPEGTPIAFFSPLTFENYFTRNVPMLLANNGHTVEILVSKNHPHSRMKGGPLQGDYELAQVHFHWGPDDHHGCENTIRGNRVAMEVHKVYFNKEYGSLDAAAKISNGIAVIALHLKAGDETNPLFEALCSHLEKIEHPFTSVEIDSDALCWLSQHQKATGYYTFPGSLTTPVESHCAIWIMYPKPIDISRSQVAAFRTLQEGYHYIIRNYRDIQPFNNRPIFYCP